MKAIIAIILFLCLSCSINITTQYKLPKTRIVPAFLLSDNIKQHIKESLKYYKIKHSNIVYAQAILETGHFGSRFCKEYNNLFGLYNSHKKDFFTFKHWSESVKCYKTSLQYKYKGGDYYAFLDSIGYAEDPEYIDKLKVLVDNLDY